MNITPNTPPKIPIPTTQAFTYLTYLDVLSLNSFLWRMYGITNPTIIVVIQPYNEIMTLNAGK